MSKHNEWSAHIKDTIRQLQNCKSDEDIEVQIVEAKPPPKKEKDSFSIFFDRLKTRKQTNATIDLEQKPVSSQPPNPKTSNISAPKPVKGKNEVIDVEEVTSRRNVQKYKQSLFQSRQARPAKPSQLLPVRNAQAEMKKQMKIIEEINKPTWIIQKEQRRAINQEKYPMSYTHSYSHNLSGSRNFTGLGSENDQAYQQFLKKRRELMPSKEKRMEERRKEKERLLEEEKKRKKEEYEEQLNYLSGIIGMEPHKKIKENTEVTEEVETLKQKEVLEQILEAEGISEFNANDQANYIPSRKQFRCGLKDHVQNSQESAARFFKAILKYHYGSRQEQLEQKRIPDIFQDLTVYRNIFHYLITTECIADIKQRLKKISTSRDPPPFQVSIGNHKRTNTGYLQIWLKPKLKEDEAQLKNYSLSKNRLALISSSRDYRSENYGVSSHSGRQFAFVALLLTPETKEDLTSQVKVLADISQYEIDALFLERKSREVYFYDLQKVTTSMREFLAVSNITYSEIGAIIRDPTLLQRGQTAYVPYRELLNDILGYLRQIFNEIQWESIREMVLRQWGFVLLQGPPGTGKTSTLMGLLSAQYEYLKRVGDSRKIMICAPSNAAVDHIVKRIIRQGFFNGEGDIIHPSILRVGIVQTDDKDVRSVSLDDLCESIINSGVEESKKMRQMTMAQIKEKIIELQKAVRRSGHNQAEKYKKTSELRQYQQMLYTFRSDKLVINRKRYNEVERNLLEGAQIILTTLTSSGADKMDQLRGEIACLIVDEAAQATQPNLLIALQSGVQKVILIGDPYQLPATCISQDSNVTLFNRSLFQRLLDAGIKPYFLNIQYRMAPLIRTFPSARFYHSRLVDADSILTRPIPDFLNNFSKRCVLFIDVSFGREEKRGDSYYNEEEAKVASLLIRCLIDQSVSLGLITPYQGQRRAIIRDCHSYLQENSTDKEIFQRDVMINTVDSFQGQERDIIVVSTVRANSGGQVGFLTDERRINVTLTRAKHLLVVIGHGNTLGSNQVWNDFLSWTEQQKCYYVIRRESESEEVLSQAFSDYNAAKIHRKKYEHLSTDIRKIRRKEIASQDFRSKAQAQANQERPSSTANEKTPIIEDKPQRLDKSLQQPKHALGSKECEEILEQKRRKEAESLQFEDMCRRMQEFERQNYEKLKGDAYYRHLLE